MYEIGTFALATLLIYDLITQEPENYLIGLFSKKLEKRFRGNMKLCIRFAWISLFATLPIFVFVTIQFVTLLSMQFTATAPHTQIFWEVWFRFFLALAFILLLLCLGRTFLNLSKTPKTDS